VTPSISVVIPSFRRPESLRRCLDALVAGTSAPDEIVVAARPWDPATRNALRTWQQEHPDGPPCRCALVRQSGQPAALNAGLAWATGEVIGFIDDDVLVEAHWVERLRRAYEDPDIGGVGGRDIVYTSGRHQPDCGGGVVGRISWFGRLIGNHHCDDSRRQMVRHLKGANMSFRRRYLTWCDVRHIAHAPRNDADLSLEAVRRGARLLYDPEIIVHHHVAPRAEPRGRDVRALRLIHAVAHDQAYMIAKHFPPMRRAVYVLYVSLIGFDPVYGVAQCLWQLARGDRQAPSKLRAAVVGTSRGLATFRSLSSGGPLCRPQDGWPQVP
jgi:GT2 family glycosyltransferase